jgi:uncharacterized membrane protein YdjX (TVP38/TMEM64 family)
MLQCSCHERNSGGRLDGRNLRSLIAAGAARKGVGMRRYWTVVGLMLAVLLLLFGAVQALGVPLLTDPSPWLDESGPLAALVGVGLLIVDVLLPVPSSLVMIAHGAIFGVVAGTVLSLIGSTGAAALGFALGRRGGGVLARVVPVEERQRADRMLERWGPLAVIATRPVPILAETTVIMAGASSMSWRSVMTAALAGAIPAALLYALTGAVAASFTNGTLVFGLVLVIAGAFWWLGRRAERATVPST